HPMKVTVNVKKCGTSPGYLFVAPYTMYDATTIGQTGALIMDQVGNPVWFRPLDTNTQNRDFKVQSSFELPGLTMWLRTLSGPQSPHPPLPFGDPSRGAHSLIMHHHYQVIKTITAKVRFTAGVHQFILPQQNTALFTAIKQVPADLSA